MWPLSNVGKITEGSPTLLLHFGLAAWRNSCCLWHIVHSIRIFQNLILHARLFMNCKLGLNVIYINSLFIGVDEPILWYELQNRVTQLWEEGARSSKETSFSINKEESYHSCKKQRYACLFSFFTFADVEIHHEVISWIYDNNKYWYVIKTANFFRIKFCVPSCQAFELKLSKGWLGYDTNLMQYCFSYGNYSVVINQLNYLLVSIKTGSSLT